MKLYTCDNCTNPLYFENSICLNCNFTVGFDSAKFIMTALTSVNGINFVRVRYPDEGYTFCQNAVHGTCNWLIAAESETSFCTACAMNRTIPTLTDDNLLRWKRIEVAKHRLVYSLLRLKLPVLAKVDDNEEGVAFDFLANVSPTERVITGHDSGTITLNIEEADEAERVRNKLDLGEKYRTLLGHFRHEIGHYYWDVLVSGSDVIHDFRKLFGDERIDYSEALQAYYNNDVSVNWSENFISPYATSHPWEDWAESWSHYMHVMDTLETAYNFGLHIHPAIVTTSNSLEVDVRKDPYTIDNFDIVFKMWLPLTFAVNSLNRSMGHADFYPFVVSEVIKDKLQFIHTLCRNTRVRNEVMY